MTNYIVADLISRLNVASKGHLKSIDVLNTKFSFNILDILYKNGLISRFFVFNSRIRVYFKYHQNRIVFYQLKLISRPGCKVF
jgi:ribosomal protein S8